MEGDFFSSSKNIRFRKCFWEKNLNQKKVTKVHFGENQVVLRLGCIRGKENKATTDHKMLRP